ncbi:MAG: pyruvate kinase [Chloroflexi bacterium]|nr:pyruvate kinase [Chloroflexota bacterium]
MDNYHIPAFVLKKPKTRIVCTLGPASSSQEKIRSLIEAGMSVARINLSHATADIHRETIANVRAAANDAGLPVAILTDLPGPKYRLGTLPSEGIDVEAGQSFTLTSGQDSSSRDAVPVLPEGLVRDVQAGDEVLIDDGAIRMIVDTTRGDRVRCTVVDGGLMKSRKAVAVPGRVSHLPYLTEETLHALDFSIDQEVDFIGLSYIRTADDLHRARTYAREHGLNAQLIAKIELPQGVENMDSILEEADGVMVARGDLGVQMPFAQLPGVQKRLIRRANELGKVVITATQMLESMIQAPTPTRAEVADIANAILDGSDAVMLSAETSIGKHPIEATSVMAETAREAEKLLDHEILVRRRAARIERHVDEAIAYSACWAAAEIRASAIVAFTESGSTAARVAAFRPQAPILALYRDPAAGRRLALRWGVTSLEAPKLNSVPWMFHEASRAARETGFAKDGDYIAAVVGMPIGVPGNTNLLRIIRVPEPRPPFPRTVDGEVPQTAVRRRARARPGPKKRSR